MIPACNIRCAIAVSDMARVQVQSGGSFDVDFAVTAPGDKIVVDGTKERQGDFVFTAQSIGEYKFCFNNEMSTFAEKMVDFEIAVRVCVSPPLPIISQKPASGTRDSLLIGSATGRERTACPTSLSPGRQPRANHQPRGIHLQTVRAALDRFTKPEVLPHAREPQFQYRAQHRAPDLQFQHNRVFDDDIDGRAAGLRGAVLFPGRSEGYVLQAYRVRTRDSQLQFLLGTIATNTSAGYV